MPKLLSNTLLRWLTPHRLRHQLVLLMAAVLAVSVLLFGKYTGEQQYRVTVLLLKEAALTWTTHISDENSLVHPDVVHLQNYLMNTVSHSRAELLLARAADGTPLAAVEQKNGAVTLLPLSATPPFQPQAPEDVSSASDMVTLETIQGEPRILVRLPQWHNGVLAGWIESRFDMTPADTVRETIFQNSILVGLLVVLATVMLLTVFLRRPLQALETAVDFADQLRSREGRLLGIHNAPLEIQALVDALNHTSTRLSLQDQALRESEKRTGAVLESALDCIVSIDNAGRITEFNPAAERTFGYTRAEVLHQPMSSLLIPLPLIASHAEAMRPYLHEGATAILGQRREVTARRRDGTEFPAEIAVVAIDLADKREFTAWVRDITDRKQAADALIQARDAAEEANRAKSDFLANMSHEIRTPMNAIIGMTELTLDTELNREQREYLNLARSSGDALLGIINEILDFSKIEAGYLEFEHIVFNLRHVVTMAVRSLAPRAREQRLEMLIHIAPDVPDVLLGDPHRLRQVLGNLLSNAIKFTAQGEIEVSVVVRRMEEDRAELQFNVRDTGIGIPKDKLRAIFGAFAQVDSSTTRKFGGTGLGLAICERLVTAMQGDIWVDSQLGHGSIFRFTALLDLGAASPAPAMPPSVAGTKVLVADANLRHRVLVGEQLSGWGLRTHGVADGDALILELAAAQEAALPFRVVLLDNSVLEPGGDPLLARIAGMPGAPSVLLMQQVHTQRRSTDTEKFPNIVGRLLKPLFQEELFNTLLGVLGQPVAADRSKAAARRATGTVNRSLDILLAEDNPINQTLALRLLEKLGHHTHVVANGQAAVEAVEVRAYDAILMDIQMPIMGGIEATAAIRELEEALGRRTPIIAMTAHALAGDRERCLAAGMDDYVPKPIQVSALDQALARVMQHSDPVSDNPPGEEAMSSAPSSYDRNTLMDSLGGDVELYGEIVRLFLAHYPSEIEALQRELAGGDADKLQKVAHSIKGAVSNFSAPRATNAAKTLEQAMKNGFDGGTGALVAECIAAIQELADGLADDLESPPT